MLKDFLVAIHVTVKPIFVINVIAVRELWHLYDNYSSIAYT